VTVGVENARHGMALPSQGFSQEALCCGRGLLNAEEKIEGRSARFHRPVKGNATCLSPGRTSESTGQLSLAGRSRDRNRRSFSGA